MNNNGMKAAVLYKPRDIRIEQVNIPKVGPYDVLVKMKRVGICGSDIHFYLEGRISDFIVKDPLVLGHECSGEIASFGDKVEQLEIGQKVVIEPGFSCGRCSYCKEGRYNLCLKVEFYGCPPINGTFSEYVVAPSKNVYPIPRNMSYEEGAMIEPLAVGMMATEMGDVSVHDLVAILGAGPIGQMVLQAAKSHGVLKTFMTDVVDYRLDYARKGGADSVINASKINVVDRIMELTKNDGVDVTIEASGAIPAINQAISITKPGGIIVLVGYPSKKVLLPISKIVSKELRIQGIHRYANVYPVAIQSVSLGKAIIKPYITHCFPFERIQEGFETHIDKTGNPMKIQICF